jgi:alcohol dehydrogenase, propanol-preferring
MDAWYFTGTNQPLTLTTLPDPTPRRGEVIVDVKAAGMCHSDVGIAAGQIPGLPAFTPIVLGHEVAGVISELGDGVTGFKVGDRVVINTQGDGTPTIDGDYVGTGRNGGYARKVTAWEYELHKLPDAVSFEQGAVATDAGMTSYNAVRGAGQVTEGTRVGMIGLGGLGLTGARIGVLAGAEVYGVEIKPDVFPVALELGVKECFAEVSELAGLDLDVIIDFAGMGTTTAEAIVAVRPEGRVIQVGLGVPEATISTALLTMKQVHLVGSLGGSPQDLAAVLDLMASTEFKIATTTMEFDEIGDGLDRLARDEIVGKRLVALFDD